jgi:GAF domain-containing protein
VTAPGSPRHRQLLHQLVSGLRARGGIAALAAACQDQLTDIDGAALSVLAGQQGWLLLSDSGPHADQLEDLQYSLREGPRVDAADTGAPVAVADLGGAAARRRWPAFAPQAVRHGIRAVFAYPVLHDGGPVGVLALYRGVAAPLTALESENAARYAAAAAVLLLDTVELDEHGGVSVLLPAQAAAVQQAVGVVMEHTGADADTALHLLREFASRRSLTMRSVVTDTLAGRLTFRDADSRGDANR